MGLATSQVRMLTLTARKADVEKDMQLNSMRKTMLTRESTILSQEYYAKLQDAKIQYATANGYSDVSYGYLMANSNASFFADAVSGTTNNYDIKLASDMIVVDAYGRVVLDNTMLEAVVSALNHDTSNYSTTSTTYNRTTEDMTIDAMSYYLEAMSGTNDGTVTSVKNAFDSLYMGTAFGVAGDGVTNNSTGMAALSHLMENGYSHGGNLWLSGSTYYTDSDRTIAFNLSSANNGTFYTVYNAADNTAITDNSGELYWNGFVDSVNGTLGKQLCNMFEYYGSIFSAAMAGTGLDSNGDTVDNYNVSATLAMVDGKYAFTDENGDIVSGAENDAYTIANNTESFQEGLQSGMFQIVTVESPSTGYMQVNQGLDYYKTQNYLVETTDTDDRETITAWYDAERADLTEKESYWDSQISDLSAELSIIETEIDSVKSLRDSAIESTFNWGNA